QCARQGAGRPPIVLNDALIDAWHPAIAKAILQNWQLGEPVCEAVGAQTEVHAVRGGGPSLVDVLVAGMRLAERAQNTHDTSSLNAGGAFARLGLSTEACQALIADASEEVRALQRALRQ